MGTEILERSRPGLIHRFNSLWSLTTCRWETSVKAVPNYLSKRPGRPPVGPRGQKRSEMRHQVTARVTDADYRLLRALGAVLQTSQADVITKALVTLRASLPRSSQTLVRALKSRRQ